MDEIICNPLYIAIGLAVFFTILFLAAVYLLIIIPLKDLITNLLRSFRAER